MDKILFMVFYMIKGGEKFTALFVILFEIDY